MLDIYNWKQMEQSLSQKWLQPIRPGLVIGQILYIKFWCRDLNIAEHYINEMRVCQSRALHLYNPFDIPHTLPANCVESTEQGVRFVVFKQCHFFQTTSGHPNF